MVKIDDLLLNVRFNVDDNAHIEINKSFCKECAAKNCIIICPAGCFAINDNMELDFSYSGCLECGSCRISCIKGAVKWNYPRGGYGVCYCMS